MKKILLVRHSIPAKDNTKDTSLLPLSEEGVRLAREKREIFCNVDRCYSSFYKRALQTAEVFSENVIVVDKLCERVIGHAKEDFWLRQYQDYDYRNDEGESLNDGKIRMKRAIDGILNDMSDGETVLVVSHATAICSYLLNFCRIQVTDEQTKSRNVTFKEKIIMCGKIKPLSCFEISYENNLVTSIRFNE